MHTSSSPEPRILVVDDDPVIRDVVETLLVTWIEGARIVTAVDGAEGLELGRTGGFDLIVTDIQMPRLSGIEMLQALRKEEIATPAIVFSGAELSVQDSAGLGTFSFLPKLDIQLLPGIAGELVRRRMDESWGTHDPRHTRAA